jgi:hypothetical protein
LSGSSLVSRAPPSSEFSASGNTLADASGEPAGPLLIDGCHRLYKAAMTGRAEIPAVVLTAAETLLIRSDAVLGPPPRPAQPRAPHPHPHHRNGGDPRC